MTKIFRWSGLIGFLVVLGIIIIGSYLFAPSVARSLFLSAAESSLGVPVEVQSVEVSLVPLGITLHQVVVPKKNDFHKNDVEFSRALAEVSFFPLLRGKVHIENLNVSELRLDQQRKSPWQPKPRSQEKVSSDDSERSHESSGSAKKSALNLGSHLPSVDEIIENEELLTPQLANKLTEDYNQYKNSIQNDTKNLPNKETFEGYQRKIEALKKRDIKTYEDFLKSKAEFDALKKEISEDTKKIKSAKDNVVAAKKSLTKNLKAVKNAPSQDIEKLKEKYQLNSEGAKNVAESLFGQKVAKWLGYFIAFYEKVSPYLNNDDSEEQKTSQEELNNGRFVYFKSDKPDPIFWVKRASFDIQLSQGNVSLALKHITTNQRDVGKPTSFHATSESFLQGGRLDAKGSSYIAKQNIEFSLDGVILNQLELIESSDFSLGLDKALANIKGVATINEGVVDVDIDSLIDQSQFSVAGDSTMSREVNTLFKSIDNFTLDLNGHGRLSDLGLKIKSNLDKRVSSAFRQRIADQKGVLIHKVEEKLQSEIAKNTGPVGKYLKDLDIEEQDLADKNAQWKSLAQSQFQAWEDRAKKKAKEQAGKKADEKAKELEDKLKDKFDKLF